MLEAKSLNMQHFQVRVHFFYIYGQLFKKLVLSILIGCISRDLASSIASIVKQ